MALFSKLRSGETKGKPAGAPGQTAEQTLQIARAVLVSPLLTCYADGEVAFEETQTLVERGMRVPEVKAIGFDRALALLKEITLELHQRSGHQMVAEAAAVLPMMHREMSLALCMQVAAADGHIDEKEVNALGNIAQCMGISVARFREISQQMAQARSAA